VDESRTNLIHAIKPAPLALKLASTLAPEAGAQCGSPARWDLCGGPPESAVPTATGAFYRSELYSLARRIDEHLVRWAMQKFKRLRGKPWRAWEWLAHVRQRDPQLFAHWQLARLAPRRPAGAV
jgi:hypothetical protein